MKICKDQAFFVKDRHRVDAKGCTKLPVQLPSQPCTIFISGQPVAIHSDILVAEASDHNRRICDLLGL